MSVIFQTVHVEIYSFVWRLSTASYTGLISFGELWDVCESEGLKVEVAACVF